MKDIQLDDKKKAQLDSNIKKMLEGGATEEDIMQYASDFKNQFGQKKNPIGSLVTPSQLPKVLEQGANVVSGGILSDISKTVPKTEPKEKVRSKYDQPKQNANRFLDIGEPVIDPNFGKNKAGLMVGQVPNSKPAFAPELAVRKGELQGRLANVLSTGKRPTNDELGQIAVIQSELQSLPQSQADAAFQKDGWGIFKKDPLLGAEFLGETVLSSLTSLFEAGKRTVPAAIGIGAAAGAPIAGIGAIGGAISGLTAGVTTGGFNLSTSGKIIQTLSDEGVDVADRDSLIAAFSDEAKMAKIRNRALKYGIPIAALDAISGGFAGKLVAGAAGKSLAKRTLAGFGEMGMQSVAGMAGEAGGQYLADGKLNRDEILLEGIAGLVTDVPEIVSGVAMEKLKDRSSSKKTLAKQVAVLGSEIGADDAKYNLNRDLANNVITPEEHEQGIAFVEKAVEVNNKIPEIVIGDNRAKSIELIEERDRLTEEINQREEQKKGIDIAYHKVLDESNKEVKKRIDEINNKLGELAKPEKNKVEEVVAEEEIQQPIEDKKADIERRRQEELDTNTSAGYGVIASDYLFTGGRGSMLSTDYLLQALTASFPFAGKQIDAIRNKYADKLGNILDDVNGKSYKDAIAEIRDAINTTYQNSEIESLFDEILNNSTGFIPREGNRVSSRLELLNEAHQNKINDKYNAELKALEEQQIPDENIQQPIELRPDLPEGYELPNQVVEEQGEVKVEDAREINVLSMLKESKILSPTEKTILYRQYKNGVMNENDISKYTNVNVEDLKNGNITKWAKVILDKTKAKKIDAEDIDFEEIPDENIQPPIEEQGGRVKVFRGIGRNMGEGENEGFNWVSSDKGYAEQFSNEGNILEEEIDKPKNTFKFPWSRPSQPITGKQLVSIIDKAIFKAAKDKSVTLSEWKLIEEKKNQLSKILDVDDKTDSFQSKVNDPKVSKIISEILSDLGYDAIEINDEGVTNYGIIKSKNKPIEEQPQPELVEAVRVEQEPEAKQQKVFAEKDLDRASGKEDGNEKGKVGEQPIGEAEPKQEDVEKVAKKTGISPKNLKDLYDINRKLFGLDRLKSLAAAITMDRMIGVMAKRAGVSKSEMYSKLNFQKSSEENIPQGTLLQVDAFHGSPYEFDKFTTQKIGTGEGAQAFGWGLYFTDLESIAKGYAANLSSAKQEELGFFEILDDNLDDFDYYANELSFLGVNSRGEKALDELESVVDFSKKEVIKFEKSKKTDDISYVKHLNNQIEIASDIIKNAKKYLKSVPKKSLYKVSLHEGKTPEQYNWLEWDKPMSNKALDLFKKAFIDEGYKIQDEDDFGYSIISKKGLNQGYFSKSETASYFYNKLSQIIGQKEASLALLEAGIDGIKYPAESISRGATSDTARGFNYVVFDENAVSIKEVIKFQKDAEKARGAVMVSMDGQATIYALTDPNVSTPVHELAHVFEHYLTPEERQEVIKSTGTQGWTIETSERFARGFEKYLANGNAPTEGLKKVFQKFKQWLTDIYNGIKDSDIDIELNHKMEEIYAKMLGEDAVKKKTPPPPIPPKEEGGGELGGTKKQRKLGILRNLMKSKNVSDANKKLLEENGLEYEVSSQPEAQQLAKEMVEALGVDIALDAARGELIDPSVGSAVFAESLNTLFNQENDLRADGKIEEANAIAEKWADVSYEFAELSNKKGKWNSQIDYFYKTSPMGFAIRIQESRAEQFKKWFAEKEEGYKEVFDIIKESEEFADILKGEVEKSRVAERKTERAAKKQKVYKKIDDWADKWTKKLTPTTTQGKDIQQQGMGVPEVMKAAAELAKKLYDAGSSVANIVEDVALYVKEQLGENIDLDELKSSLTDLVGNFEAKENALVNSLKRRKDELERRIREKDFSAEEYKEKRELTDKEKEAKEQYEQVKKEYDEARKSSKEYLDKKAKQYLVQLRKKLSGLSEEKKEEIVRRSIKKIIDSGGLEYDDFKEIVSNVMGLSKLSPEQIKEIESLTEKANEVDQIELDYVQNPTKEGLDKYVKAKQNRLEANRKLFELTHNEADITGTVKSIMTLNLLNLATVTANYFQNAIYQGLVRFPTSIIVNGIEYGKYGISLFSNRLIGTKVISPQTNPIDAQKGYWKEYNQGLIRGWEQTIKGVDEKDYFSSNQYASSLNPLKAYRDLVASIRGDLQLSNKQKVDKFLQSTIGVQAYAISRLMTLGDKPPRYAAQGAEAINIGTNELKLTNPLELEAFINAPERFSYNYFVKQGMSPKEAGLKSKELTKRIVDAGAKSVFQNENLLNFYLSKIDEASKIKEEDKPQIKAAKTFVSLGKAYTLPFVKTPANIWWAYFRVNNPALTFAKGCYELYLEGKASKNGNFVEADRLRKQSNESFALAVIGYGFAVAAMALYQKGLIRPSNDDEDKAREKTAETFFGSDNKLNLGKFLGGDDYWVDLTWFPALGAVIDTQANLLEDKKKRGEDVSQAGYNFLEDLLPNLKYSAVASLNSLVFDNGTRILDGIRKGGNYGETMLVDMVNRATGTVVGSTFQRASSLALPHKVDTKADGIMGRISNNIKEKNAIVRLFTDTPKAKISIWGEPIKQDNSAFGILRTMFKIEKGSSDKFGLILYDDFQRTGDVKFLPPYEDAKITHKGKKVDLNVEQKRDLDIFVGQARKSIVAPFLSDAAKLEGFDNYYSKLSDSEKVEALDVLYKKAKKIGYAKFQEKYTEFANTEVDFEAIMQDAEKDFKKKVLEFSLGNQ